MQWRPPSQVGEAVVTEVLSRESELRRPNKRGRTEVIAANISQILVVVALRPPPDPFLVDRYLAAAELMGVKAGIVGNKQDLPDSLEAEIDLGEYRSIGYPVVRTSATEGDGLEDLRALLRREISILAGQSGAGKSSLLNALLPGLELATGELSEATGLGRHTTSASVLHHVPGSGDIIDSPGVRDYSPAPVPEREVPAGFREFAAPAESCRFADCQHLEEPDCGVKQAVAAEQISPRRYRSYRQLVDLMRRLRRVGD